MYLIGTIYCLVSPNGSRYIGQTWNLSRRWNEYKYLSSNLKHQPKLFNALTKHGPQNFEYEILDYAHTQEDLNNAEIYWIQYYNAIEEGYNLRSGGVSASHSPETCKRLSERALKYWKEHPISEERRAKMRECGARPKKERSAEDKEKAIQRLIASNKTRAGLKRPEHVKEKIKAWRTSSKNIRLKYYELLNTNSNEKLITNNLRAFCQSRGISFDRMVAKATCRVPNTGEWRVVVLSIPPDPNSQITKFPIA